MDNKPNIIQLNLNKSRTATNNLLAHMLEKNVAMALIQEPYVWRHKEGYKIPQLQGLKVAAVAAEKFRAAIIYNDNLVTPLFVPQISAENIAVVTMQLGKTEMAIASVYLPPSGDIRSEFPALQRVINATVGLRLIVGGDFNTRSTRWFDTRDDTRSPLLQEFFDLNDLDVANQPGNAATFHSANGQSHIDLTVTNPTATPHINNWKVTETLVVSDHNAITFSLFGNQDTTSSQVKETKYVIDYKQLSPEYVSEKMENWDNDFDASFPELDTTAAVDRAVDFIYTGVRECAAAKTFRRRYRAHRPDWWTDAVERSRKIYLSKKSLLYKNRHPEYANHLYTEMVAARERFKTKLTEARQKSWARFVQKDLAGNPWGVAYRLAAEKFHKAGVLSCFTREDNSPTLTPHNTLEFLIHKLLPDDDSSANTRTQDEFSRDFRAINALPHQAEPFTAEDLDRIVADLRPGKAPGVDQLPVGLIKLLHPWTGRSLLRIYNACWRLGYFPAAWKEGKLVILLKDPTGDAGSVKNYRPITLLPAYAKILEKLLKDMLTRTVSPLHSRHQFGFTSGRSTTDALLSFQTAVTEGNRKYALSIFIDIRGAFDNVWWPGLFRVLRHKRIPYEFLALLKSYLSDRTVTLTQGSVSVHKLITKGCPQGSVLGPTLWNFMLDPLIDSEWPEGIKVVAYADDLAIIVTSDSRQTLINTAQSALDRVAEWAHENKLRVSEDKTVWMVHKSPPRVHHRDIKLRLYGKPIKNVQNQRYLGIIIDPKLNFEANATHSVQKARHITQGLRRRAARHWGQTAPSTLRTIYNGAILPILTYASPLWISAINRVKVKRQYLSLYGTFARLLTNSYVSVSTDAAGVLAGLLPTDLAIDRANTLRALKRGRSSLFQNELIEPGMFDSTAHAALYMQLRAEDIWQARWDESNKGRTTHAFLPSVSTDVQTLPATGHQRTQVLTGHGNFRCHLYRIGKEDCDRCEECPDAPDDPIHRIIDCPKYLGAQELVNEETRCWPPPLTEIPFLKNEEIFNVLASNSVNPLNR
jgi:hypothetical protein